MTEAHAHAEHKAPAKKRAPRKKAVVHVKSHAELEIDSYRVKLNAILEGKTPNFNFQQVVALENKIAKRERNIALAAAKVAA